MPHPISHQQGRINLGDLKLQIAKQLGPDRTRIYFGCLNRLLSQKLTKTEFNKLCFLILGRESIPLHNKLVRSILKNAYEAKTPPPVGERIVSNQTGAFVKKSLHENDPLSQSPSPLVHCNGDILPQSPRKKRTRKSPLGSNGTANVPSVEISIKENGTLGPGDRKRSAQHYQSGLEEQPAKVPRAENSLLHDQISLHRRGLVEAAAMEEDERLKESNDLNSTIRPLHAPLTYAENGILGPCERNHYQSGVAEQQVKIPRKETSLLHDQISLHRKGLVKSVPLEDEKKLKESNHLNSIRRPPRPPVKAPFCPPRAGGSTRRSLPSASNYDNGELCDSEELRKMMEKVAEAQGMEVTLDSANLLNNALDTYLKRLIKSTVELARVRSTHEPTKDQVLKEQVNEKPLNGCWPGNEMHVQNSVESLNVNNGHRNEYRISLQDFKAAMELNPQQLGQSWPLQLEKICMRSYEEE